MKDHCEFLWVLDQSIPPGELVTPGLAKQLDTWRNAGSPQSDAQLAGWIRDLQQTARGEVRT